MSSTEPVKDEGAGIQTEHVKPSESSTGGEAPKPQETKATVEDVPDPDEDDLDDLDDMLEEFSAVKVDSSKKPAEVPPQAEASQPKPESKSATPAPEAPPAGLEDAFSEEEFAKQLQAGMADLLGELEKSPDMQSQFEDIFKQMSGDAPQAASGATPAAEGASKSATGGNPTADASFQETIRRTMERMQNSGEQATAAAASGAGDDFMAEMLKQLSSGDLGGEGGEEEFSKMLMGMMEQLTNKEILYEPMKELHDKFPEWLDKNRATTPADDLKRYEEQRALVTEIVAKFEESSYSDSNPADREYIVDRMQKMQAAGSPPTDLVGDMSSSQDAFNMPDDQCNPQ